MWFDVPPSGMGVRRVMRPGSMNPNHWSYSRVNHRVRRFWLALWYLRRAWMHATVSGIRVKATATRRSWSGSGRSSAS